MTTRAIGGWKARTRGMQAESAVQDALDLLVLQGDCAYYFTYPKSRMVKRGGHNIIIYTDGGVPDVSSVFAINGKALPVWFDIKTTQHRNTAQIGGSAYDQFIIMQAMATLGGLTFFLVLWRYESSKVRIDEWRLHKVGTPSVRVDHVHEKVSLCREKGQLIHPVDDGNQPDTSVGVWDNQIPMPDIYAAVKQAIRA